MAVVNEALRRAPRAEVLHVKVGGYENRIEGSNLGWAAAVAARLRYRCGVVSLGRYGGESLGCCGEYCCGGKSEKSRECHGG